jgi:hemerythrin
MALLTWNSKYSVGIKTLDSQHTTLFDSLNELHSAMMNGQGRTITGPLLRNLVEYTRTHFSAEEALMAKSNFPGLAAHRLEHKHLTRQVEDFVGRLDRGEATINLDLLKFLQEWLTGHIQSSDRQYGPWLNEHGVR